MACLLLYRIAMERYVLLVEDDPDTSAVVRELIADELGVPVRIAPSRADAISQTRDGQPSVVLMDLLLPDATGDDLCEEMKSDPATKDVPIVAVTAARNDDPRAVALRECADEWVAKPFDVEDLLATVAAYV